MRLIRLTLALILFCCINSCSSLDSNRIAPGYVEAYQAAKNAIFGYESELISRDLVNSIPYASLSLKIGKGPQGLLVLESKRKNEEVWVSADEVYLVTKNGRIIATRGLINNLTSLILPSELINLSKFNKDIVYKYYYSYDFPSLNNLEVEVFLEDMGIKEVTILDEKKELTLIEEHIKNSYLGWAVQNSYWIDEDGFVWKSIQNVSPKLPPISFEVTKKPSI